MSTKRLAPAFVAVLLVLAGTVLVLTRSNSDSAPATAAITADDQALLYKAEQRLIKQCMATAGFRYDERPVPTPRTERRFPYVIDDITWAKAYGYDDPDPASPTPNPNTVYAKALPAERARIYERTLIGSGKQISFELGDGSRISTSDQGCLATARRELYDDLPRWFRARRTTDGIVYLVYSLVHHDERFAAAMKEWAACVRGRGYPVDDPGELTGLVEQRAKGRGQQAIRTAEIAGAVTEATCATTTSLARVARELHADYLTKTTAGHRREFQELQQLERAALPRAATVLGPS
ncbi:hypothetical protein GCM10009554_29800 [Kribbella koreensis]|uniref:Secreted protein n=1 Tax=Kribbella koreensis TaxID=57909 RepID=A0ABN1QA43_9ACTN